MIIAERGRDIGNFLVGRLLPFRKKRQVGPFTFIDHMGPSEVEPNNYMDVDQHPHIGLSTLTYLLEGEMEHKDSTGAFRIVTPGSVNFMTAGKGVTHTERTPIHQRDGRTYKIHGYQVWIALPKSLEEIEPSFVHFDKTDLPTWKVGETQYTLVAGEGFGRKAPVPVHSPLFMVDIIAEDAHELNINGQLKGEVAVVVVKGSVKDGDNCIEQGQMLISKTANQCAIQIEPNSRVLLFGGQAFPEERLLHWNFVASNKALLEKAKEDWRNKNFPKVLGDETYIPLPY